MNAVEGEKREELKGADEKFINVRSGSIFDWDGVGSSGSTNWRLEGSISEWVLLEPVCIVSQS